MKRKTILITEEVWKLILTSSHSLMDTPDSVLRRLLGLPPKKRDRIKK